MRAEDLLRTQQSFQTGTRQDSINQILQKYEQNQTTVTQHNTQLIKISFNNIQNIALKNKNIDRKHKLKKNISITTSLETLLYTQKMFCAHLKSYALALEKPPILKNESIVYGYLHLHSSSTAANSGWWTTDIWLPNFF